MLSIVTVVFIAIANGVSYLNREKKQNKPFILWSLDEGKSNSSEDKTFFQEMAQVLSKTPVLAEWV